MIVKNSKDFSIYDTSVMKYESNYYFAFNLAKNFNFLDTKWEWRDKHREKDFIKYAQGKL